MLFRGLRSTSRLFLSVSSSVRSVSCDKGWLSVSVSFDNNLHLKSSRRNLTTTTTSMSSESGATGSQQGVPSPFVTTEWLKKKLDTEAGSIRVLDCQWHMPHTKRIGGEEYSAKHIPGAQFFDLEECSDRNNEVDHMLPKPEQFAEYVGKLGVGNNTHVVLYDNSENFGLFSAQRIWWTFRVFGHRSDLMSILDGGLPAWLQAGYNTTDAIPNVDAQSYTASINSNLVKSMDEVRSALKEGSATVVDARPNGRFQGTAPEPREGMKPGHMPGAKNLPFFNMVDQEKKRFRNPEEIQQEFNKAQIDLSKPVIATCGSGVSACMLALGAYICGNDKVAIYDGSWVEWYLKAAPDEMENVPK